MTRTHSILSRFVPLAVGLFVAACDNHAGTTAPVAGDAQMAVAKSSRQTSITISAPASSVGQDATVTLTLWVDGHPLGGKLMTLFVDGIAYDAKRSSHVGTAEFTVTGLARGTHALSATFAGDQNFFEGSGSGSITIN